VDDERVERWLAALLATPGLTSVTDPGEARRLHVDDALAALELVEAGPVVDVGSGGGSPGLPLAAARPDLSITLLESSARTCAFLEEQAAAFPNVDVVCARAEEHAAGAGRDAYATALARALAPPPVAVEWCLPLVSPGGRLVLYAGEADEEQVEKAAAEVAGRLARVVPVPGSERRRLLVVEKLGPTPERFPRRPGVARKRPLA
jgi:16S rRNA (guanine527-N7)-methyltransferase